MRACFYIGPSRDEWCWRFFPDKSPGELPLAGKSWCRHAVDVCSLLGVTDIYLAECYYRDELAHRLGNGDFWSLKIHMLPSIPCANPEQLRMQHGGEPPIEDDLLIVWGQVLPDVPDIELVMKSMRPLDPEDVPEVLPEGIWLLRRDGVLCKCECPLLKMDSLKHYFDLNFRMLNQPGIYNLPGYSTENGCGFGMDVVIMLNCEMEKPVIIQDDVCLEHDVYLHGGVIIGKDVLVNENSELEHTIVLDHTYIGKSMYFRDKIVDGNRVIDVNSEVCEELSDSFLAGRIKQNIAGGCGVMEWLLAVFLDITLLIPYLFTLILPPLKHLAFFKFVHQIYPDCCLVFFGMAHLVRRGTNDSSYAFRYADMWPLHQDEHLKELDDIYFCYHQTYLNVLRTVAYSLLKRFFMLSPPEESWARSQIGSKAVDE
ncbi:MAG: hypothetical protein J5806_09220 [Lentisphaeria bacterium]|nr:hypothetical protein [Lentisphaeria bacterium]